LETLESSEGNIEKISATMACHYCGTKNPDSAKLCKSCKRLLTEIKWNKPSKAIIRKNLQV
jgi:NMD protein affecting ribosome stability and mRNA decay